MPILHTTIHHLILLRKCADSLDNRMLTALLSAHKNDRELFLEITTVHLYVEWVWHGLLPCCHKLLQTADILEVSSSCSWQSWPPYPTHFSAQVQLFSNQRFSVEKTVCDHDLGVHLSHKRYKSFDVSRHCWGAICTNANAVFPSHLARLQIWI